ncbi:tetratricopeptide repeat protein [Patescibacteria group bacterium]|nr:tetratricopeptide repeat protein [Patescibacteria group bacterium]
MENQTKITIIITGLLIILLGGYIYRDISSKSIDDSTATSTPGFINETTGNAQVGFEYVDEDSGAVVNIQPVSEEKELPPIPDLNKAIVFNIEMSREQKTKTIKAINEIKTRLKENPSSVEDWINLGIYMKQIGDFGGAIEAWKYASLISPLNTVPLNNLGNLYHYDLKDYPKSEEYFRKSINISSTYVNPYLNLFDLYSLSYKQDTNSAENILLEGLEKNPNQINLLITLATYYKDKGDKKNAIIYYEKTAQQAQLIGNDALYSELQNEINLLK